MKKISRGTNKLNMKGAEKKEDTRVIFYDDNGYDKN